jgi:hypothetical protein
VVIEEPAMKQRIVLMLVVLAAGSLAGCGKQDVNCTSPRDQKERDQCAAHKASTEQRGPDTLPANPKKW